MKVINALFLGLLLGMVSCIGTDTVDDPIVGAKVVPDDTQVALLVSETTELKATYYNIYGVETDASFTWESENLDVAEIDSDGILSGVSSGQSNVFAYVGDAQSSPVLATVVNSVDDVAFVTVSSPMGIQIQTNQEITLELSVSTINGNPIDDFEVTWHSTDTEIFEVSDQGVLTGVSYGFARVYAVVDGIESNRLGITVGSTSRTGTFQGANGYNASGTTELFLDDQGNLMLQLSQNFSTDFALGTYIYLANSTSGSAVSASGLEVSEITSGGGAIFNITEIDPSTTIDDFDYVIVLCKPATITFGYAQLN